MKVRGKEKVQTKSAGARFTDMRTEQDVASPGVPSGASTARFTTMVAAVPTAALLGRAAR